MQVQQGVDLGHGDGFGRRRHLDDLVARLDVALGEDTQVEAGPMMGDQQGSHLWLVHADAQPVAGHPRLGHLEDGLSDAVPVADADLVVGQPVDGEVLTELSVREVGAAEVLRPVAVGVDLVHEDGTVLTTVACEIALTVALDVEPADQSSALHRSLPDPRVDARAAPGHVDREADVHRDEARHHRVNAPGPRRPSASRVTRRRAVGCAGAARRGDRTRRAREV